MVLDNEGARERAFERSERRRKGLVYVALSAILVIAGAITLFVMLNQSAETLANSGGRQPGAGYTIIVAAGGLIVAGVIVFVMGYRILRRRIRDFELATGDVALDD